MLQCHKCGSTLQNNSGVHRLMRTSTYGDGKGFFRTVNLCPGCDQQMNRHDRQEWFKKGLLVVRAIAVTVGGGVYVLFFR
jgi:hypothetical protein